MKFCTKVLLSDFYFTLIPEKVRLIRITARSLKLVRLIESVISLINVTCSLESGRQQFMQD